MRDLFEETIALAPSIEPWKPVALAHEQWPPDYKAVYAWRIETLHKLKSNPALLASSKAYYATRPHEFIMHWMDTYDPRKSPYATKPEHIGEKWMPFVFFEKQHDLITFLHECRQDSANGLDEKCRDMGATWGCCAYSVWSWLFIPSDSIGWGSRKEDLVDRLGDADSIFEKMRLLLRRIPSIFLPHGFNFKTHATFMKIVNPENGSTISGEAGDNIGRGGRKSMYFKDESAHYERPEKVEAALGDNTNVQIDISSVNGLGNVFHKRREAGINWVRNGTYPPGYTRVFVMDWRDHPAKTQEWYDQRRAKHEREGMLHVFEQEINRNYSAAISNTIIPYEWIESAVDAHKIVPQLMLPELPKIFSAALDVADDGIDRNAGCLLQWIICRDVEEWGERDPGVSTRRIIAMCRQYRGIKIQYDAIGIGAAVKSEYNRLVDDKVIDPNLIKLVPWNAGARVLDPYERIIPNDEDSLSNEDFFENMKAQAWWSARTRFYKTWVCVKAVKAGETVPNYKADELISLDGSMSLLAQLKKELAQPVQKKSSRLKTMVDKKPDGMKSPNLGDAFVMAYFPVPDDYSSIIVGHMQ